MSTRICFVRHGETDWNADKRIQGHTDIPLNANGRAQAMAAAFGLAHHRFAAIYSSDLARALATAHAAAERIGIEVSSVRVTPGLRERNYGIFQGLTVAEGALDYPEAHARYAVRDPDYDFETGESLHQLAARVVATVENMVRHHAGETILAVTHGGVLDVIHRKATGQELSAPRNFVIPNCALNWFQIDVRGWHVVTWADCHHLERVLSQTPE